MLTVKRKRMWPAETFSWSRQIEEGGGIIKIANVLFCESGNGILQELGALFCFQLKVSQIVS